MAQLAGDSEFHDQLLQVQNAIATPGAGTNKRSAAEAGIESTGEKSAKKVSP